ncbi:MAG: UDP-N-acetylglucosamine--N-acetylmuramyl-(pentapeptide) pyrophosphoryl-undecaprenol N-acetylglucosamine transferase [Actinobacteria bacterium]|nr:UDP-N-acetylglucosamine--N-acetylmuramyl-(pentapeptide) pyrophosphoryl-undecaprenol N-acetylglucosamine transferase [Actinomycetota bacterium]
MVAAGGTGGHIYPGLATADAVRALDASAEVAFIGTPRGLEQRLIPPAGYPLELVDMLPWRGARRAPGFGVAVMRASRQSGAVLKRLGADAVVAMGGYPSLPTVLAARRRGIPVVIHESGATGGRANKLAARFTPNVALSFGSAAASFPGRQARVVGMPLSADIASFDRDALQAAARAEYAVGDGQRMVLINGGSQGSVTLNALAVGLGERWRDRHDIRVVVKTGRDNFDDVVASLAANGGQAVVTPVVYLDRMTTAYAAADVAVCRAGAGTVAELATCGLPSILVPYPFSLDDDQGHNATVLVDAGAAVMVRDPEATAGNVGAKVEDWFTAPSVLEAMASAANGAGHAHAATTLAQWVLDLAA